MRQPPAKNLNFPSLLEGLGRGQPVGWTSVGGGCIADSRVATFADGSRVFVKRLEGSPGMFECEATGLRALAKAEALRVPEVLAVGSNALVLELIEAGRKKNGFFERFGRGFAKLHRHSGPCFGFEHDNFIGSTPQENTPLEQPGWAEFFLERRLRFQVKLACRRGFGSELEDLLDRAERCISTMLGASIEPPSLLHGDLWGGNYLVDECGEACLIDPAVYFGHREADLAMTHLFGGFNYAFYEAYEDAWPLAPGHEDRLPVYQLYHMLNHLNLFGDAYYAQCRRILRRFASDPA